MGPEHKFKGVAAASNTSLVVRFFYQGRWVRVFIPVRPHRFSTRRRGAQAVIVEEQRLFYLGSQTNFKGRPLSLPTL